ncbi:MAG: hypothetical protein LBL13_07365 [Bacteroidales bacterium]|jgi:hypothetical protein|nr:hypothetical protein [Bacteroidales bacterium]
MSKTKTIKRMYSKSKTIVALLFVGLIGMGVLSSCDKTKKFDGTIWKGDYSLHCSYCTSPIEKYEITIFFIGSDVEIKVKHIQGSESINIITSIAKGRYAYNKKNITISIDSYDYWSVLVSDIWTGTVKGKTMELDIYGETITFKKQ